MEGTKEELQAAIRKLNRTVFYLEGEQKNLDDAVRTIFDVDTAQFDKAQQKKIVKLSVQLFAVNDLAYIARAQELKIERELKERELKEVALELRRLEGPVL